jgi:hypothetical protein
MHSTSIKCQLALLQPPGQCTHSRGVWPDPRHCRPLLWPAGPPAQQLVALACTRIFLGKMRQLLACTCPATGFLASAAEWMLSIWRRLPLCWLLVRQATGRALHVACVLAACRRMQLRVGGCSHSSDSIPCSMQLCSSCPAAPVCIKALRFDWIRPLDVANNCGVSQKAGRVEYVFFGASRPGDEQCSPM